MRIGVLALALSTSVFAQRQHVTVHSGQPGAFDHYLLALSWSPDYCLSYPGATQCSKHFGFVVHGFWPELADGTGLENCSSAPGLPDPTVMLDIMPDLSLVQHEWTTHGTCSGLSAQAYFALLRQAFNSIKIPQPFVGTNSQLMLSPSNIKQDFQGSNSNLAPGDVIIACPGNYLSQVEVCMSKSLGAITCPAPHDCHARAVTVPPIQ